MIESQRRPATVAPPAAPLPGASPPGPLMRLVLLGRMEAWSLASTAVLPRGRKARALLAVLGLAGGQPVARTTLGALLWSTRGLEQQRLSLRQALHEVQVALGEAGAPLLQPGRDSLALPAGQIWVDALEVARADLARPEALDLLGAELLADLDGLDPAFDAWLAERRRALKASTAAVAAALLDQAQRAGQGPAAVVRAARRLLAIDPLREAAWRGLMRAEAARGDTAAALAAYQACGEALAAQLGARPGAETEALAAALRQGGAIGDAIGGAVGGPTAGEAAPAAPRRLAARGARIGVLPLAAPGLAPEEYLSVGLAEEITAALACLRWMFVVDSSSLAAAVAREGAEAAARSLGLDFLLAGTVQRSSPSTGMHSGAARIRVSLRLTDLRPPAGVVWTQRFDREAGDLLALQDDVAAAVVARIDPEILLIEAGRAGAGAAAAVGASGYGLLLRAIPAIHRLDRAGFVAAGDWLRQATALEPDYAPALAWHAYWHVFLLGQGWAAGEEAHSMAEAERLASRAIALDPLDAQALTILGHVHAFVHHRVEEAAALHRRALALNPNLAMAWVFLGMAESYLGEHEAALKRLDRYRELAPCHPHAFFFDAARAVPLLLLGRHAEAAAVCRAAIALQPGFSFPQKVLLAALGHLGEREAAAALKARLLAIEPDFTVERALLRTPLRRAGDRAHYRAGLRLGGLG